MAEITELELSYSRTRQVSEYEPVEVSQSVSIQLDNEDDFDEVRETMFEMIRDDVEARAYKVMQGDR